VKVPFIIRKEETVDGKVKLVRGMERGQFLALPAQPRYVSDNPGSWTFGSHGNREALAASLAAGRPTDASWAIYEKVKAGASFNEDGDGMLPVRRRRRQDETGDSVSIDHYLAGDSRCWTTVKKVGRRHAITVGLMSWMTQGNGEEDFAENVAMAVALADQLLMAGYLVRIIGLATAWELVPKLRDGRHCDEAGFTFPIVDYGEPMDEAMMMAFGTPGVCRFYGFTWATELFHADGDVASSFGRGLQTSPALLALAGIDLLVAKQWDRGGQTQGQYLQNLFTQARKLVGDPDREAAAA
jgi:hypothetical protein